MNRSAYFTTDLAIKVLSKILKARTVFHGLSNLPGGPTIFVINHFTRIETLLLPYYLYHLTETPIWSLADANLFKGGLKSYFDLVGVVSTKDPQRDALVIKTLLTGQAHWIIFPEGKMVKTKKLVRKGSYLVGDDSAARSPHTGAASLALRAEIYRRSLAGEGVENEDEIAALRTFLDLSDTDRLIEKEVQIVPINLTYYPMRADDNIFSELVSRYVKDPSERMLEELMTEGTMLLEGVDIDIHFGQPLEVADELKTPAIAEMLQNPIAAEFYAQPEILERLRAAAQRMMQLYMERIYSLTAVNHDHLFASFLRRRSFNFFSKNDLARSVFVISEYLQNDKSLEKNLHLALKESQIHLLTDDRYDKLQNFIDLGLQAGGLVQDQKRLKKQTEYWQKPLLLHKARLDNLIEVMANEVEPLAGLQKHIRRIAWIPDWLLRIRVSHHLYIQEQARYKAERVDCEEYARLACNFGRPFLLPNLSRKTGIVFVHSYLSVPEEIKKCAQFLRNQGAWVYGVRLPGHGTSPETLATIKWTDWREALERGFALINGLCKQVFLIGFSAGGSLAMELGSHLDCLSGVVAICPPYLLQDYSKRFMPPNHVWKKLLARWKGNLMSKEFVAFEPENSEINYRRNPVAGVNEVGELLQACKERLPKLNHPVLIIYADRDQVVNPQSGQEIYDHLGTRNKTLVTIASEKHNVLYGPGTSKIYHAISAFIRECIN